MVSKVCEYIIVPRSKQGILEFLRNDATLDTDIYTNIYVIGKTKKIISNGEQLWKMQPKR